MTYLREKQGKKEGEGMSISDTLRDLLARRDRHKSGWSMKKEKSNLGLGGEGD